MRDRIPLGPGPSLHRLRRRHAGFVRRLHSYFGRVSLLPSVHRRLWLLTFPTRSGDQSPRMGERSPGSRTKSFRTCQSLRPRRAVGTLALSRSAMSPSVGIKTSALWIMTFAAQWLAYALPCRRFACAPSRAQTHGLGPMWIATPSSHRTCTDYSLPVSRRTIPSAPPGSPHKSTISHQ